MSQIGEPLEEFDVEPILLPDPLQEPSVIPEPLPQPEQVPQEVNR